MDIVRFFAGWAFAIFLIMILASHPEFIETIGNILTNIVEAGTK